MDAPASRGRGAIAFILSGVFPGLGQLYNHEWFKGGAFVVAGGLLSWLLARMLPDDLLTLATTPLGPAPIAVLCLLLAVWLWSAVDAWRVGRSAPDPRG